MAIPDAPHPPPPNCPTRWPSATRSSGRCDRCRRIRPLAVHLRLVEDYSFVEVARLMGKSPAACQMLVLRAGRSLRTTLRQEGIHA